MNTVILVLNLAGSLLCVAAVYAAAIWWQVRGLSGLMMVMVFTSMAFVAFSSTIYFSPAARVSLTWVMALQMAAWLVGAMAGFVLADQYAARRNNHRALSTILYMWFLRLSEEHE